MQELYPSIIESTYYVSAKEYIKEVLKELNLTYDDIDIKVTILGELNGIISNNQIILDDKKDEKFNIWLSIIIKEIVDPSLYQSKIDTNRIETHFKYSKKQELSKEKTILDLLDVDFSIHKLKFKSSNITFSGNPEDLLIPLNLEDLIYDRMSSYKSTNSIIRKSLYKALKKSLNNELLEDNNNPKILKK